MANKMQWLIDAFNDGKLEKTFKFRISDSGKDFGTVCMPTGTGKSGVMIEDIVSSCLDMSGKAIINLSCPTLRLSEQLVTDLFETVGGVFNGVLINRFCLVLNSSDSPYNYNTQGRPVYSGGLENSINKALDDGFDFIVIASCHKSLQKFVGLTDLFKNRCTILNYIDESHLMPYRGWYDDEEEDFRVDLHKLHCNSDALYLISATPDYEMTMELSDGQGDDLYLYKMYPIDAINENVILPPRIHCIRCENFTDTDMYLDLLDECKQFGGYRKILITLKSTDELRYVRESLERRGFKVFSATAADGFTGGDTVIKDAVEFADVVDEWDGDCFVLQIKQLTQGTDIRTLTDCIMPVANEIGSKTYRNLIQTMGRVLRAAPGERGKSYEQRTKKAGNIFFLLTPDADPAKEMCMRRFALRYYGLECALYGEKFRLPSDMTGEIEGTKDKIRDYVCRMSGMLRSNIKFGSSIEEEASEVLETIDPAQYYRKKKSRKSGIPEYHLLDNRSLIDYTEKLIESII